MSKLPHFKSLDELVEFWETHDFSDYVEEMEEIELDSLSSDSGSNLVASNLDLILFISS